MQMRQRPTALRYPLSAVRPPGIAARLSLVAGLVALVVCLGLGACRRTPSEYSGRLVLHTVSRHPIFDEIAYEKLEAKVAATDEKVRLETPDFVLIFYLEKSNRRYLGKSENGKPGTGESGHENQGWLLLNRGRLEVVEPGKPRGAPPKIRQPAIRKYIPITAESLAAWPRLAALVVLAAQLAPPPDGKAHVCVAQAKDCRKVATEALGGRAAEKWEYSEGGRTVHVWTDVKLGGVPVHSDLFELKNIVEEAQDRAMFELPKEYEEYK